LEKANVKPGHPTNAKKKLQYWKKQKKANEKVNAKKNGKRKKRRKKSKQQAKKRLCFFVAFLFFFKNMEKAEKSKSFFAFSVAFFYFRICMFFASFKSLISWSAFLDCFLLLFVYAGSG